MILPAAAVPATPRARSTPLSPFRAAVSPNLKVRNDQKRYDKLLHLMEVKREIDSAKTEGKGYTRNDDEERPGQSGGEERLGGGDSGDSDGDAGLGAQPAAQKKKAVRKPRQPKAAAEALATAAAAAAPVPGAGR